MDADTEPGPDPDPDPGPATAAGPDSVPDDPDPVPVPEADPDVEPLPRGRFRCRLCQISAANRPSLVDHLRGKKHRRLRSLRAERRAQERRSLFVSGFARGTSAEELAGYFGAFGDVAGVVMDKEKGAYAIVELREAAGRELALAAPRHELAGQRLRVRPRQQKGFPCRPPPGRGPPREPLEPAGLERELCQAADVDAQLRRLVELLELSEAERRLRNLLVTLFQEVFSEFFPGCSVLPFGSSVNGFDARGCDLDLLLDLEPATSLPPAPGDAAGDAAGEAAESLLSGPELAAAPRPALLELVAAVLRRCAPGVHRVRPVPGARRPVVKFCHRPSGLAGDVSLDNRLGLLNSRFLHLCAAADPRVRPLVYALRFWAKQQRLAGNPAGGGPLLSNYALTLLALFFLQSRRPPVLPSLERLRQMAGPQDRTLVAGWDCTFPGDPAVLEPSANTQTPAALLPEFFSVFGTFDFSRRLLSLREGRALPLPPPAALPSFKRGPLNLQDPFELDHNVAANVTGKTAARFGHCCREAAKYCRSLQYRQKSGKGKPWGVTRLFRPAAAESGGDGDNGTFTISVPLDGATSGSAEQFQEVCDAVAFVLREVLGCGCTGRVLAGASGEELAVPREDGGEDPVEPTEASAEELAAPVEASGEELTLPTEASGEELVVPREDAGEDPAEPTEASAEELAAPTEASGVDPAAPMEASGMELAEPTEGSDADLVALIEASGEDLAPLRPLAASSKRPHPAAPNGNRKKQRVEVVAPAEDAAAWSCLLHHRVWMGRRRLRRQLLRHRGLLEAGGGGEWLELEREVTATIAAAAGTAPEPVLRFRVGARPAGARRVLLSLVPRPPQSLFQEFFHFLRSFLPGAVRQRLGVGTGVATDPQDGGDSGDAPTP